jgi:Fur family ferric uptake transcriptional regulator
MSPIAELQRHGFRKTAQRGLILGILEKSGGHLTAAQIADAVDSGSVPLTRSTVYRTLDTLVEVGIIQGSRIGRSMYYEYAHHAPGESHHHLVCSSCRSTVHIHGAEVDASLTRAASAVGFKVADIQVLVGGLCRGCRRTRRRAGAATA